MFLLKYFTERFFPHRYFPKQGEVTPPVTDPVGGGFIYSDVDVKKSNQKILRKEIFGDEEAEVKRLKLIHDKIEADRLALKKIEDQAKRDNIDKLASLLFEKQKLLEQRKREQVALIVLMSEPFA